jgi:hypothetical protein
MYSRRIGWGMDMKISNPCTFVPGAMIFVLGSVLLMENYLNLL